jgi:OFA family oxalate/formate antiporter-like MFS transporter
MFLLQAILFFILPSQREFTALASICFVVISCYGGGFGTMPAFAADFFGAKWVGSIYGLMLTAWGFGGVFGPLLVANIRQSTGKYDAALVLIALIMLVSSVLPLIVRAHRVERQPVGAGARG